MPSRQVYETFSKKALQEEARRLSLYISTQATKAQYIRIFEEFKHKMILEFHWSRIPESP